MKKLFLIFALVPLTLWGQPLKSTGISAEEVIPEGWTCQSVSGDMNKDGIRDMALIAYSPTEGEAPVLAIYWGEKGGYRLWRQYPDKLLPNGEFDSYEYTLEITDKGVLKIGMSSFYSAGSWNTENNTYVFRYQQGDFFLIGEDNGSLSRNTGRVTEVSINYLTHKKQEKEFSVVEDGDDDVKERWSRIPKKPLKSLSDWGL